MNPRQRHHSSGAQGVSTGVAPTPPLSQVRQQNTSKRCREAEDAWSLDTEAPITKRRTGVSRSGIDGECILASSNQTSHSAKDLAFVNDTSELYSYSDAELDELFTALDDPQPHAHPEMSIDDLLDETLFLEDLDGEFTSHEPCQGTLLDVEAQQPPSSVLRGLGCASNSADEFDQTLQFSSPHTSSTVAALSEGEPPLLTQDEDWQGLWQSTDLLTHGPSPTQLGHSRREQSTSAERVDCTIMPTPAASASTRQGGNLVFKAFKTFFHLDEMLDAKTQIFKTQSETVFDLFARVLYSSRENFVKKQYFQFRDLFKETPPYFGGALLG